VEGCATAHAENCLRGKPYDDEDAHHGDEILIARGWDMSFCRRPERLD
jgi:hypothetical protein